MARAFFGVFSFVFLLGGMASLLLTVRPKTIVCFEGIIFGTLLLGLLGAYGTLTHGLPKLSTDPDLQAFALSFTIVIFVLVDVLVATLTLLVSHRRSKIAMWVLIAMFVLGLVLMRRTITYGQLLQGIGQLVAFSLLFTPSARRWMNREDMSAKAP
jgi:hypothetical protein